MVLAFVMPIVTLSVPVMSSVPVRLNCAVGGLTMIAPPSRVMSLPPRTCVVTFPTRIVSPPAPCAQLALIVNVSTESALATAVMPPK